MLINSWFENYFTKEIFRPVHANSAEQKTFSSQKASESESLWYIFFSTTSLTSEF